MADPHALPYRDFVVPAIIAEQSAAWLAQPEDQRSVARAKPSSTVMLLRTGSGGIEVFVLRRASSMAFAAGMLAFPGGGVDRRDADPQVPWAGPSPAEWATRLGTDEASARELVIAAAREVFEECGVLLASPSGGGSAPDLTDPARQQERVRERDALLDRSQSFGELLTRTGLVLRSDLLAVRGHWITPTAEPRRYDTRFFAARLPAGQVADGLSSEAAQALWARPADLLAAQQRGTEVMLPPTQVMLEQLAALDELDDSADLDSWLATPVPVHPVQPWPVVDGDQILMRTPVGPDGHGLLDLKE